MAETKNAMQALAQETLHGLLFDAAAARPDHICLQFGDHPGMTYTQVNEAVTQCAEYLAGPGVKSGLVFLKRLPPWALCVQHVEVVAVAGGWGDGLAVMVAAAFAVIQKTARAAVNH